MKFPGERIIVLTLGVVSSTPLALTQYCGAIDPEFARVTPASTFPTWAPGLNRQQDVIMGVSLQSTAVADTPFCVAFSPLSTAAAVSNAVVSIINRLNQPIQPTSNAMALNLFELATNGFAPGTDGFDLTNSQTAQAWPMMTMSYLYLDKTGSVSTCANKRALLDFLLFFFTSPITLAVADSLKTMAFSPILVSQLNLLHVLQSDLTCLGVPLTSSAQQVTYVGMEAVSAGVMTMFSNFYLTVDTTLQLKPAVSTALSLAVVRVAIGEYGMATINAAALSDADVEMMREGDAALIPAFLGAVVPIFRLPSALMAFYHNPATSALGLPALFPLLLDLETTTALFLGLIPTWTDARMLALNPQLELWFAQSHADPALTVVVGATSAHDQLGATRVLFQQMRETDVAANNSWAFLPTIAQSGPNSNPFLSVITPVTVNNLPARAPFILIDLESRLTLKLSTLDSGVSYRMMNTLEDITEEFQFVHSAPPKGVATTAIPSSVAALQQCGTRFTNPAGLGSMSPAEVDAHVALLGEPSTQRNWVDARNPEPGCWPISTLVSFVAKLSYSTSVASSACTVGLHSLEFINYIQTTSILSGPSLASGVVRVADSPLVQLLSSTVLYSAQCDGEALLVVPPVVYRVGPSLTAFGEAVGGIGVALMSISLVVVATFRYKTVMRSSSAPLMALILLGMAVLLAAIIPWAQPPTTRTCSSFLWLANLGYMLMFCPLFAKTWRVWRIFSGSHLRLVKITNRMLLLGTLCVVLLDVIIVSVWQGVSPLQPVQYQRLISGSMNYFTHCSVPSQGSGIVFVALIAVEKMGLLLFGAVMAFTTRNVKGSFNESSAISWSIYNTLMSFVIGVSLIVFVAAVEDTLMLIVIILIAWIVFSVWGLVFAPKFQLLMKGEEAAIEASKSSLLQEKSNGFSFASIAVMTMVQVKQYYSALKTQVHKAERMLGVTPPTVFAAGPDAAGGGNNDSSLLSAHANGGMSSINKRRGPGSRGNYQTSPGTVAPAAYASTGGNTVSHLTLPQGSGILFDEKSLVDPEQLREQSITQQQYPGKGNTISVRRVVAPIAGASPPSTLHAGSSGVSVSDPSASTSLQQVRSMSSTVTHPQSPQHGSRSHCRQPSSRAVTSHVSMAAATALADSVAQVHLLPGTSPPPMPQLLLACDSPSVAAAAAAAAATLGAPGPAGSVTPPSAAASPILQSEPAAQRRALTINARTDPPSKSDSCTRGTPSTPSASPLANI